MIYDYVIVGSGLTGLIIANRLSQETEKVILLESGDHIGGWLSRPHLPFYPSTQSSIRCLQNLESLLNLKIIGETVESSPVTFDSGELKPFMGFGDKAPDFYDEAAYFCLPQSVQLKLKPSEWIEQLKNSFKGTTSTKSIVTRFQVENGQVQNVLVNGTKKIQGKNFIFCGDIKDLERLIPHDFNGPKVRTKISKTKTWSRATLVIDHKVPVTDSTQLHVLMGTSQDEIVTCLGSFENTQSLWTTFVADEEAEDPEITAQALKRIKRQIKRAYPESFPDGISEKIVVQSGFGGHFDVKLNANQTWPDLENLWMGSSGFQTDRNLLGALKQSWLVLASLGFSVSEDYFEEPNFTVKEI